jgi:hypothetical protein
MVGTGCSEGVDPNMVLKEEGNKQYGRLMRIK